MTDVVESLLKMSESPHYAVRRNVLIEAATELAAAERDRKVILQAIRDPENQPSQYATVPVEWHEAAMSLLRRALPYVGSVRIDDVPGDDPIYDLIGEMKAFIVRGGRP